MKFKSLIDDIVTSTINESESHQVSIDREFGALTLNQKVGKFFQAVLVHDRKCRPEKFVAAEEARRKIAESLADVVGMAAVNAHLYDVDIEQAIKKKWLKDKGALTEKTFEFDELMAGMVDNAMNYGRVHDVLIDREFGVLKLGEEVAEFSEAVLIHDRKCRPEDCLTDGEARKNLANELADVVGMAAVNAHLYDVDIEQAIRKAAEKDS